jgi:hypothetical protein
MGEDKARSGGWLNASIVIGEVCLAAFILIVQIDDDGKQAMRVIGDDIRAVHMSWKRLSR